MADKTASKFDQKSGTTFDLPFIDNGDGTYSPAVISSGKVSIVRIEFTRENNATPYGIGDVISGSAGTPLVYELPNIMRVNGGTGLIQNVQVEFNVKSVVPTLRLNFFDAVNPTISGDNLPHQEKYADVAKRLGWIDLPAMITAADSTNSDISRTMQGPGGSGISLLPVKAATASRSLWVSLQTLVAVTLTASSKVTITVTAFVD